MRTILVLTGGSKTDQQVSASALAVAKPLGGHLNFLHVRISQAEAASNTPHLAFLRGAGLTGALEALDKEALGRSAASLRHFKEFCAREAVPLATSPVGVSQRVVSGSWSEEQPEAAASPILLHARHNDLVVLGRATRSNRLPSGVLERLLLESGRPVLIAPEHVHEESITTALVCWKETPEAARALAIATPILKATPRVVLLGTDDSHSGPPEAVDDLAKQLQWNGIDAETRWLPGDDRPVEVRLQQAIAECDAGLVVMGAYGHGRMREAIFGGCTRHFLENGDRPVLMMH
jgi:nucleotide-binding universal stress UspA family protein